ncbi:hypothetical protein EG329_010661 [Mollisiaceae sp. DMI_Dod_QoI]|nr:hypothetical protein EG329_010661 [Helotiales sp. DMI_Dod_QoI]
MLPSQSKPRSGENITVNNGLSPHSNFKIRQNLAHSALFMQLTSTMLNTRAAKQQVTNLTQQVRSFDALVRYALRSHQDKNQDELEVLADRIDKYRYRLMEIFNKLHDIMNSRRNSFSRNLQRYDRDETKSPYVGQRKGYLPLLKTSEQGLLRQLKNYLEDTVRDINTMLEHGTGSLPSSSESSNMALRRAKRSHEFFLYYATDRFESGTKVMDGDLPSYKLEVRDKLYDTTLKPYCKKDFMSPPKPSMPRPEGKRPHLLLCILGLGLVFIAVRYSFAEYDVFSLERTFFFLSPFEVVSLSAVILVLLVRAILWYTSLDYGFWRKAAGVVDEEKAM